MDADKIARELAYMLFGAKASRIEVGTCRAYVRRAHEAGRAEGIEECARAVEDDREWPFTGGKAKRVAAAIRALQGGAPWLTDRQR